jgi:hypothetical protein
MLRWLIVALLAFAPPAAIAATPPAGIHYQLDDCHDTKEDARGRQLGGREGAFDDYSFRIVCRADPRLGDMQLISNSLRSDFPFR